MSEIMMKVKLLPPSTSRLLCSGQIISSIFCVVKELVENSLDSGCSSIDVKMENFGLDRIEVRDNGHGIHPDDIPHVVKPHYTSKISSFTDLETLKTFGFRGEALGALCSVADLTICSKTSEEDMSKTYVFNHNGEVVTSKPSASLQGTTVIAACLFKNIPVRRQIYKSEKPRKEEMKKIESLLCAFACSELGVRFALYHNRNVIWQKPAVNDIRSAMIQVYGSSAVNDMIQIHNSDDTLEVKLEGFFPKPDSSVSKLGHVSTDRTIVAINKRPVRIKEIDKVLQEHYLRSADFNGSKSRYPFCFLSISLPPCKIDVNIEPNKTRILLHSLEEVKSFLAQSLGKLYHPAPPSKMRTELPAIPKHKLKGDSVLTETELCIENTNLLSSERCVRENNSDLISRSSALINEACYPVYEPSYNNFAGDTLKVSSCVTNSIPDHSKHDNVVKNMKTSPESSEYTANKQMCSNVGKEIPFNWKDSSDVPKNIGNQRSVLEMTIPNGNSCRISSAKCPVSAESLPKQLFNGNGSTVFQPLNSQSSCSLSADVPLANKNWNSSNDSVNLPVMNSNLSDRAPKNVQSGCTFSTAQNAQTDLKPCYSELNRSLISNTMVNKNLDSTNSVDSNSSTLNRFPSKQVQTDLFSKIVVNKCLDSTNSVDISTSTLKSFTNKQVQNDFQSGLSFLKHTGSAETYIVPRGSESSFSSNVSSSLNKLLNSSSECVRSNPKVNPNSEGVEKVHYQNDSVLSRTIECENVPKRSLNYNASGAAILATVQRTENWSMGRLCDSEGKKLEPFAILTKSPVKRVPQEDDFIHDAKRKKCATKDETDAASSDLQTKQPVKSTLSAFGLFCREFRLEVALQNPGCSNQDIAKLLTERWNNLPFEKKVVFENRAKENGSSNRKVKKKLGTTLSQTLLTLSKKKKKSITKKISDQDQDLIKKRKAKVVQFNLEDLKTKSLSNSSECSKEMKDEYSVISCLSPGSWICLKGCELLLLNSFRLREMLIYHRLMETYVFPSVKLSTPVVLNESMIGSDGLWKVLFELVQDSNVLNGTFIVDKRITSNGFKIRIGKDEHSATLIGMPSCLPFCGVNDLVEILEHLKQGKESALLRDCRPVKAIHFLQLNADCRFAVSTSSPSEYELSQYIQVEAYDDTDFVPCYSNEMKTDGAFHQCHFCSHGPNGEAVRIVRQSPDKLRKDEVENLLRQKKSILAESSTVCIHNKPFFHVLHSINAVHSQEFELQDC